MRIIHYKLIPVLPRQQLLQQHRTICGLRGKAWGKKHSTINYVFIYNWEHLYYYHSLIIKEMKNRTYKPNPLWDDFYYRGKRCKKLNKDYCTRTRKKLLYPEHTNDYLKICCKKILEKIKKYDNDDQYRFYVWLKENNIPIN